METAHFGVPLVCLAFFLDLILLGLDRLRLAHEGVSFFFYATPKLVLSFWFPFKDHKKGVPSKQDAPTKSL